LLGTYQLLAQGIGSQAIDNYTGCATQSE